MRRIKLFAADMYPDENKQGRNGIGQVRDEIQLCVDHWLDKNPTFIIEHSSISISKEEALLSVVYTIEVPFDSIK